MEDTIMRRLVAHGRASWLLAQGLFITGCLVLVQTYARTGNPLILLGVVAVLFAEIIKGVRTGPNSDDPRPSWWPGKRST